MSGEAFGHLFLKKTSKNLSVSEKTRYFAAGKSYTASSLRILQGLIAAKVVWL